MSQSSQQHALSITQIGTVIGFLVFWLLFFILFLGVLDFSFTAQNGGFTGPLGAALQSGLITVWCVAVGWIIAVHGMGPRAIAIKGQ